MIRINLPKPMFIDNQAEELAGKLDISSSDIMDLLNNKKILHDGKLLEKTYAVERELMESGVKNEDIFRGSSAILELSRIKGIDPLPLTEISIPMEVLFECNSLEWFDLSLHAVRIERRATRYSKLAGMQAPMILTENEELMMKDAIVALEHNHYIGRSGAVQQVRNSEDRVLCSLYDIGYSLLTGWNEELREHHKNNPMLPTKNGEWDF